MKLFTMISALHTGGWTTVDHSTTRSRTGTTGTRESMAVVPYQSSSSSSSAPPPQFKLTGHKQRPEPEDEDETEWEDEPLVTPAKQIKNRTTRSPSACSVGSIPQSYATIASMAPRSAKTMDNYIDSDERYTEGIDIEYKFSAEEYEKAKQRSELIPRKQKHMTFDHEPEYTIEDHVHAWRTKAVARNEHPADLCQVLIGNEAVGSKVAAEFRDWARQYGQAGSTMTTAWIPALRSDIPDCWRWLRAIVTFLCRKYRTMYTTTQVMNEMMRLRMTSCSIEGLSSLWTEVMRWYRRLSESARAEAQLKQVMTKAIMESQGPTTDITVETFVNAYKDVLRERGDDIDQREAIELTVKELEKEFKSRPRRDRPQSSTAAPPSRAVRVNTATQEENYHKYDWYDEDEYLAHQVNTAMTLTETTAPTSAAPQPSQQRSQQQGGGPSSYQNRGGAYQGRGGYNNNGTTTYNNGNNQSTRPYQPFNQPNNQSSNQPSNQPNNQSSSQANMQQTNGNGARLNSSNQDARNNYSFENPKYPDGSFGCSVCGDKTHLRFRCPHCDDKGRLSIEKLAQMSSKEGMLIFERARRYGNISRIAIEFYNSMKKRLIEMQEEFAGAAGSTRTFKSGGNNSNQSQQIQSIRIISNHVSLFQGSQSTGVLFQTNPQDPLGPDELASLLQRGPVSNETLSYFNLKLRRITKHDIGLSDYENRAVPLQDNDNGAVYEAVTSMKDSGSSTTLCNTDLVKRINAHVVDCDTVPLMGLAGAAAAGQVAVFIAVVEGTDKAGWTKRWKLLVHALIVPRLASELLLGADFINKHRVRCDPDRREAIFFRGDDSITVAWVPWAEVEGQLRKEQHKKRVRDQEEDSRKKSRETDQKSMTVAVVPETTTMSQMETTTMSQTETTTFQGETPLIVPADKQEPTGPTTEHEEYLAFKLLMCTKEYPELRPPLFPVELWPLVVDQQKRGGATYPSVLQRWSMYPDKRLAECIQAIYSIKICEDTEDRREQRDMFRAQAFANIDALCHVDELNPPCTPDYEANIELLPNAHPYVCKMRRKQPMERACEEQRVNKMIKTGRMEVSKSEWNNPTLLVANVDRIKAFLVQHGANAATAMYDEANADEVIALYRLTMDFRELNKRTRLERFPLPRIIDLLDKCTTRSNRYSGGDIADAYFCIPLRQSARELTAFSTADTHVHYTVLPQGLHSAPAIFSRIITDMFMEMRSRDLVNYFDDVINHHKPFGGHFNLNQRVYDILRENKLTFKPSKTTLNYHTQKILGHVMTEGGRAIDPEIIRAVMRWSKPNTLTDVQSMIGTAKVATPYIENLASRLAPLHELNRKNIDIAAEWREDYHGKALDDLKKILTTPPVLMIPENNRTFRVHVDACKVGRGLGAVLLQINPKTTLDGKDHWSPCCYWSRALTTTERNLSSVELECTAMHDSILHWHQYLYNTITSFEVIVDCYALVYLVCKMGGHAHSHQRLTRLCLDLQGYFFSVTHRKGTEHIDADALSRLLQQNEVPYVRDEAQLREDTGPLTDADIEDVYRRYTQDAETIITTINRYRQDKIENLQTIVNTATMWVTGVTGMEEDYEHCTECNTEEPPTPESPQCGDCDLYLGANSCIRSHTDNINEDQGRQTIRFNPIASVKKLEKLLARPLKWNTTDHAILRGQILEAIASRGLCNHDIVMSHHDTENNALCAKQLCTCRADALTEHEITHTHCRRTIRSLRSCTLHELFRLRAPLQLSSNMSLRITEEVSRRAYIEAMNTNSQSHIENLNKNAKQRRREERRANLHLARYLTLTKLPRKPWRAATEDARARERQKRRRLHGQREQEGNTEYWEKPIKLVSYTGLVYHDPIIVSVGRVGTTTEEEQESNWVPEIETSRSTTHLECDPQASPTPIPGERHQASQSQGDRPTTRQATNSSRPSEKEVARRQDANAREATRIHRVDDVMDREYALLEDHHHLHQQHYMHPETNQMYQIIDTICVGKTTARGNVRSGPDSYQSIAWPVNSDNDDYISRMQQRDEGNWDKRKITGPGGTIELVKQFMDGHTPLWNLTLPREPLEWLIFQQEDSSLTEFIERCASDNVHLQLHNTPNTTENFDYIKRSMINKKNTRPQLGPLCRHYSKTTVVSHGSIQHTVYQTFNQMVVPKILRKAVLYSYHDQMGHPGSQRLLDTIRMKHWWPGMSAEIKLYAQQCRFCELRKANNAQSRVPIQAYRTPLHPFHVSHVDLTGPLSPSEGFEYIMIFKDALTKFTLIRKLPDKKAKTVAAALIEIFCEYGAPRVLVSDRGTEFVNFSLKNVCKILMVHRINCTPSNPRSNGLAENANRTIKDMLTFYCNKQQSNWATYISTVQHIYNTTINLSTGYTPFYLLFGRECPSPDEEELTSTDKTLDDYAKGLRDSLALAWDALGGTFWQNKTDIYNAVPRKRLPFKQYKPDQLVYIKRIPKRFYKNPIEELQYHLSSKLQERFSGPFRITATLSPVLYKAMIHGKERVIHAVNMKPARVQLDVIDEQEGEDDQWQEVRQFEEVNPISTEVN